MHSGSKTLATDISKEKLCVLLNSDNKKMSVMSGTDSRGIGIGLTSDDGVGHGATR
jgi:hypothetical protein